jgi:hypothetical protein
MFDFVEIQIHNLMTYYEVDIRSPYKFSKNKFPLASPWIQYNKTYISCLNTYIVNYQSYLTA